MNVKLPKNVIRMSQLMIYAFVICYSVSMVFANETIGQRKHLNEIEVVLTQDHNDLIALIQVIEETNQFGFSYTRKDIRSKPIHIKSGSWTMEQLLNELSVQAGLSFRRINEDITVKVMDHGTEIPLVDEELSAQVSVSGTITDENGEPLPGATIQEKETTIGTITDSEGRFSLNASSENAVLVVSFVGYEAMEVLLEGRTTLNLSMIPDIESLQEVVVVGFGTQKKENLTGAVSTVNTRDLEARPVRNVGQALQGLVPGLNITQSAGGNLNNTPSYNIRGLTTIGQGSSGSPLILIDGMQGDINTLTPQDIESISVLKDAAASSIYGSRAPFGVILITTKKGSARKPVITYSNNFRWNSPIQQPEGMDSYTFALMINDASYNTGQGARFTQDRLDRILDHLEGRTTDALIPNPANPTQWGYDFDPYGNTDWFDVMWKDGAPSTDHAISVRGGTNDIKYFLSASYLHQNGLLELSYDDYNRYNVIAKVEAKMTDWATIDYSGRWGRQNVDEPTWYSKAFNINRHLGRRGWPTLPVFDNNGYYWQQLGQYDFTVGMVDGGRSNEQEDWTYHQVKLTLEPIKGWKVFGQLNAQITDSFNNWYQKVLYNRDVSGNPVVILPNSSVTESSSRVNFINPNVYTEYSKSFGNHFLKVLVGSQHEYYSDRWTTVSRDGLIVSNLPVLNLTSGTDINGNPLTPSVGGTRNEWATAGYFSRINYDFGEGKYLAELNFRYDGTSRFREDKRWNLFPSFSLGWNVARENFWQPLENTVNDLKFRASYGVLGNQNTSNYYPTYVTMPVGIANGSWLVNGARTNTASAPGLISSTLGWESVESFNFGLDMGLFQNRLTASLDYFIRYTNDMIGPAPELPDVLGTAVPRTNNTDLKTYGFELNVAWQDQLDNDLRYDVRLLLFDSQSEITNYPNPTGNLNQYRQGQTVGEIWGYTTIGIAQTTEEMDAHLNSLSNGGQNALGANWNAGDIMYEDANGDGKVDNGSNTEEDHGDLSIIGNSTPRYSLGLNLGADWKGFDFKVFFQGIMKRDYFQGSNYFWGVHGSIWETVAIAEHGDYFRNDPNHPKGINLDSYYPRPAFGGSGNKNHNTQTAYLQDASYLRLKNAQLGYTLPVQLTQKAAISKFRIYVSAENILTFTKLAPMFDPETIEGGYGGNVYPLSKIYSGGVMITF